MRKMQILVIAPYSGLKEVFLTVSKEYENVEISVREGNLTEGLEIANDIGNQNYDVIISRGGTTMLIARKIEKPVVDLKISAFDMLRIIKITENFSGKMAIVGFPNIANCAHLVSELLNYPIDIFTINTQDEVERCLSRLRGEGYQLIIGDVVTLEMSQKMGMNGVLLTSGEECVRQAIDEAVQIYEQQQRGARMLRFYEKLLEGCKKYIVVRNEKGTELYNNGEAEDEAACRIIRLTQKYDAQLRTQQSMTVQVEEDGCLWNIDGRCARMDESDLCVYYITRQYRMENSEQTPFSVQYNGYNENFLYFIKAVSSPKTLEQIITYTGTVLSVLLVGEKGVGKSCAAYEMHQQSSLKERPFITIDCRLLNENNMAETFSPQNKALYDREGATVYFKDIDILGLGVQKYIYQYMNTKTIAHSFRFLASANQNLDSLIEQGQFMKKLYDKCSELKLYIPPLREMQKNIRSLSSLYLSKYNAQFGARVIGIEGKAMQMLENYPWPGNVEQFNSILKELVLSCKSSYISMEDTEQRLKIEDDMADYNRNDSISLEGSLEDIECRVVQRVLQEENMNQSKAADRLKISRSTIWRKLK